MNPPGREGPCRGSQGSHGKPGEVNITGMETVPSVGVDRRIGTPMWVHGSCQLCAARSVGRCRPKGAHDNVGHMISAGTVGHGQPTQLRSPVGPVSRLNA